MKHFITSFDFSGNQLPIFEVDVFGELLLEMIKKKGNIMCFCMYSGTNRNSKPGKTTPFVFLEGEKYNKTLPIVYMNDTKYQEISKQVRGTELTEIIVVRGEYIPVKPTTVIYGVDEINFLNKALSSKQTVVFESEDSDDEQEEDLEKEKIKNKKKEIKKGKK
jgi:hypothetical protein